MVLHFSNLRAGYCSGAFTVVDVVREILRRIENAPAAIFIHRADSPSLLALAESLQDKLAMGSEAWRQYPLLGFPFVVKDNLDVAGMPTTAACPALEFTPGNSAETVRRLLDAGALCLGKTNMDQLATGLVGVRSPYGLCRNAFDARYIAGGSSSGSGLAISLGLCSFALGTDTAGSGRVPAALGNTLGFKPTRGLLSTRGLLPACPSLDCVSVFSLTAEDAAEVIRITAAYDEEDPWSRQQPTEALPQKSWSELRLGLPRDGQLDFSGNRDYSQLFQKSIAQAQSLGASTVEHDIGPLLEAAKLLYQGPWIAERYASIADRIETDSEHLLPVLREILAPGAQRSAAEVFRGQQRLQELRRASQKIFAECDALLLPTLPTVFTLVQIEEEPITRNSVLGRFTNFVNLLDLCAVAIPAGFDTKGLPFGITLVAPAFHDTALLKLAEAWQRATGLGVGVGRWPLPPAIEEPTSLGITKDTVTQEIPILVFGLHLSGQPLAHELESLNAKPIGEARTGPGYAMRLLVRGERRFPGVLRDPSAMGNLAGEIWQVPAANLGAFLLRIRPPLGLGWIELADGNLVLGFLAEAEPCRESLDITAWGGWLAYLKSVSGR